MALRRREDEVACAALGLQPIHLPLLEAPHRGYHRAVELFQPPHIDDPVREALAQTLAELIDTHAPDEIWAPRGLGGHVDHVLVHRASRDAAAAGRLRWWTDWPYVDRPAPADPEAQTVAGLPWEEETLSPASRRRKADACAAYASQLGFQFGGEAAMRARVEAQGAELYAVARP